MRIVAIADSLALPRFSENGDAALSWDETWPSVLAKLITQHGTTAEIINCGQRARTIESLIAADFDEHVLLKRPDVVIFQVGIVDCAPRVVSLFERRLLNLGGVPASFRGWLTRRRAAHRNQLTSRDPLRKVYVKPARFKQCLAELESRVAKTAADMMVIWIPILGNQDRLNSHSCRFSDNIRLYNQIVSDGVRGTRWNLISPSFSSDCFASDGYHLNAIGSARLAADLFRVITTSRVASAGRVSDRKDMV